MYEDDDEFDGRNAIRRGPLQARPMASPPAYRPPIGVGRYSTPSYAPTPCGPPPYPWQQPVPAPSPLVDRYTGTLKLGVILEAAAQALAAMASLPTAPPMSGDSSTNATNMVKYQESLAQHAKRDEQIRTIGALARLFLV